MKLAVFDLDETLIAGDSSSLFAEYLVAKNLVSESYLQLEREMMKSYAAGELDIGQYVDFYVSQIPLTIQEIHSLASEFTHTVITPLIYPQAKERIEFFKALDYRILIVSATVSFIVTPIALQLGVPDALGINMQTSNGVYTGQIQGTPSYQEGKVERIQQWLSHNGTNVESTIAFSDSRNDLPLLQYADQAVVVNGDPHLVEQARQRGWQIEYWWLSGNTSTLKQFNSVLME